MAEVHVLDHPLIQHKLAILRSKDTPVKEFRELVGEIAGLMCYEATRKLPLKEVEVETPVATAKCRMLSGKKLAIVPVLRAGLGMVDQMVALIPSAKIGHIGLYRDPETHKPVEYYCKLPEDIANRQVFVVDPMLATGGSAVAAIDFLKKHGCKNIIMMNIIGAPEGVAAVQQAHPDVEIYLAALDEKLNEHALLAGCGQVGGAVREYDKRHKLPPKFRKVRRGRGKTRALRAFLFFFLYYIEGKTNRQEKSKKYGDTFRILRLYRRFPRNSTGSRGNKWGFSSSFLFEKVI